MNVTSRNYLACVGIFLVALIPILSTPILPLIDFYNHMARYFVLSQLDRSAFLAANYASNWSLLPNIGMDVIGTALFYVLPPSIAPHAVAIAIAATLYFGVLSFNARLGGKPSILVALLLAPLLYSFIFIWGFANFLFGLGLTFWAASWWIAMRDRPRIAIPVACLLAVLIFLAHGLTFALYGLFLGAIELGFMLTNNDFSFRRIVKSTASLAVQAVLPVILFANATTSKAEGGFTNAEESIDQLIGAGKLADRLHDLLIYRLQTIVRVSEGPTFWFDLVSFLIVCAAIGWLVLRKRVRVPMLIWPALAIAAVLIIVTPPTVFGVGYVGDRMPLFGALIFLGALQVDWKRTPQDMACLGILVALVAVRLAVIGVEWRGYDARFQEFEAAAASIPPQQIVKGLEVALDRRLSETPRCEMYGPLLVLRHDQASPLFANATQQPIKLAGRLKQAVDAAPKPAGRQPIEAADYVSDFLDHGQTKGGFDYVLICGAAKPERPVPSGASIVAQSPNFTVVKFGAP